MARYVVGWTRECHVQSEHIDVGRADFRRQFGKADAVRRPMHTGRHEQVFLRARATSDTQSGCRRGSASRPLGRRHFRELISKRAGNWFPPRWERVTGWGGGRRAEPRLAAAALEESSARRFSLAAFGCPPPELNGAQVQSERPLRPGSRIHVRIGARHWTVAVAADVVRLDPAGGHRNLRGG